MATESYADLFNDAPEAPKANLNLRFGVEAKPDQAAEAAQLARRYRLPVGVVSEFREDYKQKAQVDDARAVVDQSPKLRGWLAADENNARMSHDDTQTLGGIEGVLTNIAAAAHYVVSADDKTGLGNDVRAGYHAASAGTSGVFRALTEFAAGGAEGVFPALRYAEQAGAGGGNPLRRLAEGFGEIGSTEQKATDAAASKFEGTFGKGVSSGIQSLTQNVITAPLMLAPGGQGAALTAMSAQQGGSSYQKAREQGINQNAALVYGVSDAAIEFATEKLPMSKLLGDLKAGTGLVKTIIGQGVREIPGEQIATALQDMNEWAVLHPEKPFSDYLAERPSAAAQTLIATLIGVGGQTTIMHSIDATMNGAERSTQKAQAATVNAQQIEQLTALAAASKLKARDATTFKGLVAQIADEEGDAPTEFFIDPSTLANSLNQSGVTVAELAALAPTVAQQLQNPTGADIRVPVSEFLSAGEAVTAPLIDHLRVSEDAMTRAEAQDYLKTQGDTIKADVEAELQKRDDSAVFRESIDGVRTQFQAELDNAKRFTPAVNAAYADLLANFYGAQASRLGMTPETLLDKYKLRVQAASVAGERTLNQEALTGITIREKTDGYGFEAVNAEGKVVGNLTDNLKKGQAQQIDENASIDIVKVQDEARGQGIGPALYAAFNEKHGGRITPSGKTSLDAWRLWKKYYPEKVAQFVKQEATRIKEGAKSELVLGNVTDPEVRAQVANAASNVLNQGEGEPLAQLHFAKDITSSPSVISLLQGSTLSSFLHESGHFFLEVQSDLAGRIQQQIDSGASVTPAERGIVDDMNKLLEWFGVKGNESLTPLDEWSTMTLEQKRESHEKFARGFEAFTYEGKAPSMDLQAVFSRFRSWLGEAYKLLLKAARGDFGDALKVKLNDDVRAVMGRMLATDFAIEEAEAARNMGPLFKSAVEAEAHGVSLEAYNALHALAGSATDAAVTELQTRGMKDMKWMSRAKDKALKARQEEVDAQRREIRNEVRAEVMAEPVYQAWQFLTGKQQEVIPGTQPVDEIDAVQQSGKLRTEVLRDMYGTEETAIWRELSARRMTSDTTGMHPDIVGELFGYDSGDALVKALVDAMPPNEVIEARTDQRMLEMFGDINSPEALERAADEAVHNEVRARFIAAELKALADANTVREKRGKSSVDVLARAAKAYARDVIARLKVRDIRPNQYATAEARSARLAEKALASGKLQEAAQHKRNQLVNNYATKAAYDAQDEVKSAQAYFRKFDKRSKSIDASYQDQIEGLLERFDFRQVSLKEVDRRKAFSAWYADQAANGIEPNVPAELLDDANRKSYKDMTIEELRGLRETVEQIEHIGRLKNRLLLARDQKDFEAAAAEMATSIIVHGGKARPLQLEGPNPVTDWFAGVGAQHRKLASLFREMDGNKDSGPMYNLIGRAMNERGTMEDVMVEKATMALRDLYAPIMKLKGGVSGYRSKLFIPEINASLTRGGRLSVALNWGNEDNRQRVIDGDHWSEGQVRAILHTLSPTELQFVNGVWEYIDSFWPEVAAKEKRLTGVTPEKVEASPFKVVASDGTEVDMRGGYYPLKYDTDRSDRADTQEAAQAAKEMMQGAFTRATTRRGHTNERVKEVKRAVRKDLNVITQHVTEVTHDLAWHEWLIDTNKLLSDDGVVSAIRDHYGPRVLKTMRDDVMGIATADVAPATSIDTALLKLRSNVTRATMGASLTTAFLQPFGLTQSIVRIGPKHVLRGMARWGGDAARMENTVGWIKEKSDFMRLRAKTLNKELREIRGAVGGKSRTMTVIDAGLFALMQKMQMVADVPTWVGQYEKSLSDGLDEDAAVAMADRAVLESQGGGQTKDLAEVQRKHPMLTQFYSYFSVTLNLAAEQTAATNFKDPAAVAGWLGDMALLMVIPAIIPSMIMFALKGGDGDDEKGWWKRIGEWQLGYLLGTVVGLREFSGPVGGFDYAGPPVGRIVGDIGKAGKQTAQGELDDPAVMAYVNLMGSVFGIPTVQALRSYKGWKAWSEGQEGAGPQSVLFGPPPKN
jgi:GNAT superfamily N-acetyltransferase